MIEWKNIPDFSSSRLVLLTSTFQNHLGSWSQKTQQQTIMVTEYTKYNSQTTKNMSKKGSLRSIRMKKVLEEPCSQNRNGILRQSSLRPPRLLWHHTKLLYGPLLPYILIGVAKARNSTSFSARAIILPEKFLWRPNLSVDGISEAAKVARDRPKSKNCVRFRSTCACYCVKRWINYLHFIEVLLVSSINL